MNTPRRPISVLLAKPGLDGHDHGAKVVMQALLEAGMRVHYTGLRQTPEMIAQQAQQQQPDVIALSSMAGSHVPICEKLQPLLQRAGLDGKLWIIGGNLPQRDHARLRELGFRGVFPSSSRLDDIVKFIEANVA
jgi:methylmalonyl-CoA mutase C-terminal domain/subunit